MAAAVDRSYWVVYSPRKYMSPKVIGRSCALCTYRSGIMKAFRTIPGWLGIVRDAEELCPNALSALYLPAIRVVNL